MELLGDARERHVSLFCEPMQCPGRQLGTCTLLTSSVAFSLEAAQRAGVPAVSQCPLAAGGPCPCMRYRLVSTYQKAFRLSWSQRKPGETVLVTWCGPEEEVRTKECSCHLLAHALVDR